MLHCEGWKSVFCNPTRPAFLAEMPIALNDVLAQTKRWNVGLLEVALSKHSPLTFGRRYIGSFMAHCYSYYAFGPFWSVPIMFYAFIPQITMLNNISIFPKVRNALTNILEGVCIVGLMHWLCLGLRSMVFLEYFPISWCLWTRLDRVHFGSKMVE